MKKKLALGLLATVGLAVFSCNKNQFNDKNNKNLGTAEVRAIDLGFATQLKFSTPYVFTTATYDPILGSANLVIPTLQGGKMFDNGIYDVSYTLDIYPGTSYPDYNGPHSGLVPVEFRDGKGILPLNELYASSLAEAEIDIKLFFKIIMPAALPTANQTLFAKQTYVITIPKRPEFTATPNCSETAYNVDKMVFDSKAQKFIIDFKHAGQEYLNSEIFTSKNDYTFHAALTVQGDNNQYKPTTATVTIDSFGDLYYKGGVNDGKPFQHEFSALGMDPNQSWGYYAYLEQNGKEDDAADILAVCSNLTITPVDFQ